MNYIIINSMAMLKLTSPIISEQLLYIQLTIVSFLLF